MKRFVVALVVGLAGCEQGFSDHEIDPLASDADGDGVHGDADCDDADPDLGRAHAWYPDGDGDGCSTLAGSVLVCDGEEPPAGHISDRLTCGEDCDDGDAESYPGAAETTCDDVDQDCDGGDLCEDTGA
jgi:hypothetical protein